MKIGTKIRQAGRCFAGCREGKTVTARKIQWTSAGNCVVCTTSGAGYGGGNKTLEREKRQIKPAREKRVVRWLSRDIAHIERVKKHARVKNRTRAFLWCVILCPLEYTLPLRLFQLFQHLEWWIKTQAVTLLKIVDGFDVSPYGDEKTEVILDFKNLYLIYIK